MSAVADSPTSDQAVAGSTRQKPRKLRPGFVRATQMEVASSRKEDHSGDGSPVCAAMALSRPGSGPRRNGPADYRFLRTHDKGRTRTAVNTTTGRRFI